MLKFNLHNELDKKDHFLNTTFDSVDEFMDWMDEDYDKFVDEMETSREDWSGVHDFTSKYENGVAFVGYSSYEIKNFEAALNKWKEYFKSRGKLHDNSSVSKVKVTANETQKTAVEWQHIELSKFLTGFSEFTHKSDILIKAKEMENEQHKKIWDDALKSLEKN
jgi:hypothetical protein